MTFNQNISEEVKKSVSSLKTQLEEELEGIFNEKIIKMSEAGWANKSLPIYKLN